MTAEFYKNVYQTNNFKLRIFGNKKVFEETQIGWRQYASSQSPFYKSIFGNNSQNLHGSRFQSFLVFSNVA